MAEPTLYLFDGYNLLHAGPWQDRRELRDALAGYVALRGARGVLVFDGVGDDEDVGRLAVRYAPHADTLLERLAVEGRGAERVCLVSSDAVVRGTAGRGVAVVGSQRFAAELTPARDPGAEASRGSSLADRVDDDTRAELERLRRGL